MEMGGLVAALTKQVAVLRTRYNLTVEADLGEELHLPMEMKQALYRVAQEALHNMVKHARDSMVVLQLPKEANASILGVRSTASGVDQKCILPAHLGWS